MFSFFIFNELILFCYFVMSFSDDFSDVEPAANPGADPNDHIRSLEKKINELETMNCCGICLDRMRDVAFLCGHSSCYECSINLQLCHICRRNIDHKIKLYLT